MIISDERLREIAEVVPEDYYDLGNSVRELAIAILERGALPAASQALPPAPATRDKRLPGKPLGDKIPHPCPRCGADVVTFISKKTNKPYQCDIEMGYYQKTHTALSAANWFHNCGGGR